MLDGKLRPGAEGLILGGQQGWEAAHTEGKVQIPALSSQPQDLHGLGRSLRAPPRSRQGLKQLLGLAWPDRSLPSLISIPLP